MKIKEIGPRRGASIPLGSDNVITEFSYGICVTGFRDKYWVIYFPITINSLTLTLRGGGLIFPVSELPPRANVYNDPHDLGNPDGANDQGVPV